MRKALWLGFQIALGTAVAYAAGRALATHWDQLAAHGARITFRPGPVSLAATVVLGTYALLIESWRQVLAGWDQRVPYRVAARIWTLSNVGRYLPGKVWSVAGMAVLASRAGVAPWAAAGSAVILQALAIGTGAALVAATAPAAASGLSLAAAVLCAAGTVAAVSWPPLARRVFRLVPKHGAWPQEVPPLRGRSIALGAGATLAAWGAYGLALRFWAEGTLPDGAAALDFATAAGAFTASYVIGLLALFAPGGVLVREGVLFTLLQGPLGPANAVALAVGSRLLLTVTEVTAALVSLTWRTGRSQTERAPRPPRDGV